MEFGTVASCVQPKTYAWNINRQIIFQVVHNLILILELSQHSYLS
jgi:hypothetical protein